MRQLNIAIIGQGRSGRDIHGKHLLSDTQRFKVVAVVDEIEKRRVRAQQEFNCDTYKTYQELFERNDIDFVVNSSTSHFHKDITIDLLKHGFNVLVEKPCAKTANDVDEMIAVAKESGKMLAVFQQSRFAPYFEKIQEIINSGELGRIIQISIAFNAFARRWDWQCCQEFNAGSLYNTGPHPVDQALTLLAYEGIPDVLCKMDSANSFGDAEDYVKIILTAPNKPLIDIEISSCDAYSSHTYKIQGTKGGLTGTMTDLQWRYFSELEAPEQTLIKTPLMDEQGFPKYCAENLVWIDQSWHTPDPRTFTYAVRRFYDTIYNHIVNNEPLPVTLQQVRKQIAVMEECHKQNSVIEKAWKGADNV